MIKQKVYTSSIHTSKISRIPSWVILGVLSFGLSACPERPVRPQAQKTTDQALKEKLTEDATALKSSYIIHLSQDATPMRRWNESDGLVSFFQGDLSAAVERLDEELTSNPDNVALRLAFVRATIELVEVYAHISELESYLLPQWLTYERKRPQNQLNHPWYDWVELTYLTSGASQTEAERREELSQRLSQAPEMSEWTKLALDLNAELPTKPKKPRASYRRWLSFAQATEKRDLKSARRLFKKLKLKSPMLILKSGNTGAKLKLYDPRVTKSLRSFYTQMGLERCEALSVSGYYCGRLYELQGSDRAQAMYQRAYEQLKTLRTSADSIVTIDHLLLSAHLSLDGFFDELDARLTRRGVQPPPRSSGDSTAGESAQTTASSKAELGTPGKARDQSTERPTDVAPMSLTSSRLLWSLHGDPKKLKEGLELFPQRRYALSALASELLESTKGEALNEIASYGLTARWLDELHYRYAQLLVANDLRVMAMKTLNAAEEVKHGGHLKGRNRLGRLTLNAYNYLKMDQQRVTVKYLRRLQKNLPALSYSLGMTSDVLSGKSFEQKEGNVTSGQ